MAKEQFRHSMPLRVRWAEVDPQSIVFNAHYLTYCDICVTEYWRAVGIRYPEDVLHAHGVDIFVVKSTLEYHASARFDDVLDIRGRIARMGRSSMLFRVEMYRGDEHLITGEIVYVCAGPESRKSTPVPGAVREKILAYEVVTPEG
ncbi:MULTISPECIES: YbgC/FadM family acyl-CoA thioesterase [Cupriavidus]|uniref:YbgC/FadM family acyl-CoA thioesterase n=1 Tax=Cupriavidus sp. WS TaxID=1312922 RepID=UPI00037A2FA7|nr:YbgC/FadM family acyl-CoA thioesterase [Cupriavidus sp. WS]